MLEHAPIFPMTSPSPEPVQPAPLPGLTNVVLLEKIRETPRTIWYRACQEKLGREVLLKARPIGGEPLISGSAGAPGGAGPSGPSGAVNEPAAGALARAREEMVLLSRLHSDAIVAAIDVSASGPWLYQMVELPPGRPLTRAFQERGRQPWPVPEALAIAERVAEGLEHAHRAEIILRRLHPEDLFLGPDARVKISSLEWAIGPGISPGFPAEVSWLAPEVAGGATAATRAADSHALGLLLAWLLTGRDPASGLRRADEKAVEALRARGAREDVVRLVARLLDPVPENRPAGGAEALEAVRALGGSLSRPRSARRAVIVASAAVILAAALTVALSAPWGPGGKSPRGDRREPEAPAVTSGQPVPWRTHPKLQGRFHSEHPDDLQVLVHDGGPRLTDRQPELVWVTVTGCEGELFSGSVLNQPTHLRTVQQGQQLRFIMPAGGEFPVMVTEKYLRERPAWKIGSCEKCGFSELFDAPSDLMRAAFPDAPAGAVMEMFTAHCPLCGGVQAIQFAESSAPEAPETPADSSGSSPRAATARSSPPPGQQLLQKERANRSEKGRAAVAEFRSRDLAGILEAGDFARAAKALDALSIRFPEQTAAIADLRRELDAKEKEAVARLGAEIDRLLAAGNGDQDAIAQARRRAAEGSSRLTPPRAKPARSDFDARIAREERARAEAAQRLENLAARAREAFEAERFEEAASTLEEAGAPQSAAGPIQALSREIAIARAARESILSGLDRAIAGRTPVRARIYSADGTLSAELELVLDERRGSILTAHRKGNTARMNLSAYDLESAALEALAGPAGGGDAPKELKEGLLALLLSQGRPEAAAPLLAAEDLAAPVRAAYAGREQAVRARRLGELAREAARRLEETSSRKSPPAAWSELKTWVAGIISRNASGPSYAERAGDLEKVFLASAREALRSQAPDRLFRGRVLKERRSGQVQVLYDFDDPGQAADWIPATKTSRLIPAARAVRFSGSLRFLNGNPFGGSMGVAVKVPAKGIANPPHLGLILGSPRPEEGGKKTAPSPEGPPAPAKAPAAGGKPPLPGEAKDDPPPAPAETESPAAAARSGAPLAFVLGFVPAMGEGLEMPNGQGTVQVATPASALFAGAGLPPDPEQVIFAVPTPRHTGPLFVRAEVAPGHLSWTVNGKPVLQSLGEGALKALAKLSPAEAKRLPGSVVLYCEDEPVTLDTIEVYGALDERWVEERLAELAREELEGLRRALPPRPPQGGG